MNRSSLHAVSLRAALVAVLCVAGARAAFAQASDLAALSLEELLNVEITSVALKEQTLLRTAAAVYVVTEDDIRRSGATTLADVLRMVPGFAVAQVNANSWSVTARGFGGVHANKLLMLIDGRSTYTPLNGGVNWEMQSLPLDAIARIEAIRGPGGSLWGTNAINGVINIITKTADRSQGSRLRVHASHDEPGAVDFSIGTRVGATGYQVSRARYVSRRSTGLGAGQRRTDDIETVHGRTRWDWGAGVDRFSVHGDMMSSRGERLHAHPILAPPFRALERHDATAVAGSALFSWKRATSSRVENTLQLFYSGFGQTPLSERAHTVDIDARQHRRFGGRHDVVAGVGYRDTVGRIQAEPAMTIEPLRERTHLATAFVEDEIALPGRVALTPGTKLEHNPHTGLEVQPSIHALWAASSRQSVWGAVSRAVRTPNRFERGMHLIVSASQGPAGLPLVVTLDGSSDTSSEIITAYETGYRVQRRAYSVDVTGFVGRYADLASQAQRTPGVAEVQGVRVFRVPLVAQNDAVGIAKGAEVASTWRSTSWLAVAGSYSLLHVRFESSSGTSASSVPINGPVPQHLIHVRAHLTPTGPVDASALFYRAAAIPSIGIEPINRLDLRVSWLPGRGLQVSGGVRNLLHPGHPEYVDRTAHAVAGEIRSTPYGEVLWRF